jgi:cobaltochelatase CobS
MVFDEYDAGRPDVMFVIQRVLEREGSFTLLDQKRVIQPHPCFRLFATMNTLGQGNLNGSITARSSSTMPSSIAGIWSPA